MPDYVVDEDRLWLGGYLAGGDEATIYPELWDWFVDEHHVGSVVDVGCGEGHALKHFRERGVQVLGYDGIPQPDLDILEWDFTEGAPPQVGTFDLAWCCEFVEHVEEQFMPNFLQLFKTASMVAITHGMPGQPGHHHVNCVVEGTKVASPNIERAFRRRYLGEVITLVTSNGDELTVTPNHPIATPTGWAAAGLLQQGDDLVGGIRDDWIPRGVMPNSDQTPVVVEQVFGSLEKMSPSGVLGVPTSAKEFHGDGRDGKVDVVGANSLLGPNFDAPFAQQPRHQQLRRRRVSRKFLAGLRPKGLGGLGVGRTTSRREHDGRTFGPLRLAHSGPGSLQALGLAGGRQPVFAQYADNSPTSNRHQSGDRLDALISAPRLQYSTLIDAMAKTLGLRSDMNPSLGEVTASGAKVGMSLGREFGERFSRQVAITKLVGVHRSQYVGHVYNLSTDRECYWANGLIVHNCQMPSYWKGALAASGFTFDRQLTMWARVQAARNKHPSNHFVRSGLIFRL